MLRLDAVTVKGESLLDRIPYKQLSVPVFYMFLYIFVIVKHVFFSVLQLFDSVWVKFGIIIHFGKSL